ncbi:MAG TPA: GNAT family N-acetyltransferase [Caulifigura sp.]|nr:GNAT family N-acetyltransferase [Caulifigura sp.]
MAQSIHSLTSSPPASEPRSGLIAAGTTPLHRLDGGLWVDVVDLQTANSMHGAAWDDLAANACDPNAFFERWFLNAAMPAFERGRQLAIACVYRGSSRKDVAPGLVGLFPIEVAPRRGCLSRTLRMFSHEYAFLLTPLIRQGHAVETWETFLDWADQRSGCDVIELSQIRGDGAVAKALAEVVYRRPAPSLVSSIHTRAVLRRSPSAEESLSAALTTKQRHEYSRQTRRLSELGPLEFRRMESQSEAGQWIDWFIELESRGWKGEAGTALAEDAVAREFFTKSLLGAAQHDRLQALGMWLNGRPIALKLNLLAGPGSFAFKIAYDEEFYKFSPGVLLELENVRILHDHCDAAWMDSCAAPNHPMINRIWRDRVLMQQILLSTGTKRGNLAVGFRPLGRVLKHMFKRKPAAAQTPAK